MTMTRTISKTLMLLVCAFVVALLTATVAFATTTMKATTSVNMRAGEAKTFEVVTVVPGGETVEVLEMPSSGWYKVKYDGKEGYIWNEYLESDGSVSTMFVNASAGLNLRDKAGMDGNVIALIPDGTEVKILGKDGTWYQVEYDGKTGYCAGEYLKGSKGSSSDEKKSAADDPNAYTVVDAPSGLNVREAPSMDAKVIGALANGEKVKVTKDAGGGWFEVDYDGKTGYCYGDYLKAPEGSGEKASDTFTTYTVVNAPSGLNVREAADKDTAIIGGYANGAQVKVTKDMGNGWLQVNYNGKVGYCYGEYLKAETIKTLTVTDAPSGLNVRQSPSMDATVIGLLENGAKVDITKDAENGWYQVDYNGKVGYCSADYLK